MWNTSATTSSITANPLATSNYSVIVSNATCSDTSTVNVVVYNYPVIVTNNDTSICPGSSIQLYASGGGTYSWFPSTNLSCTNCQNPIAIPEEDIIYCVTVNYNGCVDSTCLKITTECENFFIPNAFTPDDNGLNEKFKPKVQGVHDYHFLIFDRWGENLFETNDIQQGWNGYYQSQMCESGVYIYKITFTDDIYNKHHQYIGKVTLLR